MVFVFRGTHKTNSVILNDKVIIKMMFNEWGHSSHFGSFMA